MEDQAALLQRYRADRRKLLQFLLSSSAAASLSSVDFDTLSADYVLHRLKSGEDINVGEATKARLDNSAYPVMIDSKVGSSYFLVSDPDVAGSPPRRVPPHPPPPLTEVEESVHVSSASSQLSFSNVENVKGGVTLEENDYGLGPEVGTSSPTRDLGSLELPPLGLRGLITGLSDDDLRESAFELLLASIFFSGVEMHPVEDKKKEKSPNFLSSLKSKRDKTRLQPQPLGRHSELMDIVRVQMHIMELLPLHKKFLDIHKQLELKLYDLSLFQGRAEQNEHHKLGEVVRKIEQEVEEAKSAAKEKEILYEQCVSKVLELEKSIKEHDNNRKGNFA